MPRTPRPCRCVRSAERVNEAIRRLVERGGPWDADEYERLLLEWAAAQRGEYVEAA